MPKPKPIRHRDGTVVWRVRFRTDESPNPVSETFITREAASRFARLVETVGGSAARAALDVSPTAVEDVPTLEEACLAYIELHRHAVARETSEKYEMITRLYITPLIGPYPVTMLTREMLARWMIDFPRRGRSGNLSAGTAGRVRAFLSSVLESLASEGVLPANPLRGMRLPRGEKVEPVFLSANDLAALIAAMPEHYVPLVATIAGTGLRIGEAIALTVADVELDADIPVIRVTKTWRHAHGGYAAPPKTKAGRRTVSLPTSVVEALRPLVAGRAGSAPLFTDEAGRRIRQGVFRVSVWKPAVARSGLSPAPRIHDLRHTHASHLIARGVPLTVIQRRLGHSSIQVTSDTYGHLAPEAMIQAAAAMDLSLVQSLPQIEA